MLLHVSLRSCLPDRRLVLSCAPVPHSILASSLLTRPLCPHRDYHLTFRPWPCPFRPNPQPRSCRRVFDFPAVLTFTLIDTVHYPEEPNSRAEVEYTLSSLPTSDPCVYPVDYEIESLPEALQHIPFCFNVDVEYSGEILSCSVHALEPLPGTVRLVSDYSWDLSRRLHVRVRFVENGLWAHDRQIRFYARFDPWDTVMLAGFQHTN